MILTHSPVPKLPSHFTECDFTAHKALQQLLQLPAYNTLSQALAYFHTTVPIMAETEATLSKVDSATQQPEVKAKRRPSSMAADCYDILDLRK